MTENQIEVYYHLSLHWPDFKRALNDHKIETHLTRAPCFSYTGVTPAPPPGNIHSSPSEDYWAQVDLAGARQAVNLVNGVIVDGLGHVSLDSGPSNSSQQPNIHQGDYLGEDRGAQFQVVHVLISPGSIPATGRRDGKGAAAAGSPASASSASAAYPPASCATSLPFNQLIGGAVSPGLLNTNTTTQPLNFATNSANQQVTEEHADKRAVSTKL